MRDIVLEETVYLDFTTRAFATGVPGTLGGTPVLSVLEENNATPITAGVSVSVDRASVAGLNMATIVATTANGYELGKGYSVYISTGTVGGVSVIGEIVAEFTIGASAAAQDLANGTDGLTALKTGIDAIPTTAMRGTDNAALASVCTEVRLQALTDWLDGGRLDALLDAIPTAAMRGTDGANTVVPDAAGVAPTAVQIRQEMDTNSADLNTLVAGQTTINNNVLSNSTDISAIPTTPMRGTDNSLLAASINLTGGAVDAVTDVTNDVGITQAGADKVWVSTSRTLTDGIQKNAAFSNLEFLMVLASDHVTPATGLTVTGTRSIDGGAFIAITGAIAEVSSGIYQVDLLAADTNGDVITYRFSAGTADDTFITVTTS